MSNQIFHILALHFKLYSLQIRESPVVRTKEPNPTLGASRLWLELLEDGQKKLLKRSPFDTLAYIYS